MYIHLTRIALGVIREEQRAQGRAVEVRVAPHRRGQHHVRREQQRHLARRQVDERQQRRRRPDVCGADVAQLRQRGQQPHRRLREAAVRDRVDGDLEAPHDVGRQLQASSTRPKFCKAVIQHTHHLLFICLSFAQPRLRMFSVQIIFQIGNINFITNRVALYDVLRL